MASSNDVEVALDAVAADLVPAAAAGDATDAALRETCASLQRCVQVDCTTEKARLDDTVDEMLTRLEEFSSLLDIVRADSALCLEETMPRILAKRREMEQVFASVDQLEAFVATVRLNLQQLEEAVEKAESERSSLGSIKKVLSSTLPSFLSRIPSGAGAASTTRVQRARRYVAPPVFSTDSYFQKDSEYQEAVQTSGVGSDVPDESLATIVPGDTSDQVLIEQPTPTIGDSDHQPN
ncbi:PREDICTED: biogenesis of lysosome-related organelles complex 1 subunit 4-like [Priapulus caudatus]|uniref:Biogenesis of lysosome-related organelles complex 1 subunit 4-like n=1 Tax=Priapulus caudatus TaxID=37621 RepID=A0ABM1EDE2_PRICU|nr:PREDICTED: biogenesis of lysosome-related organelles complex 1 subunit 4-like [Priapulus caudatus]